MHKPSNLFQFLAPLFRLVAPVVAGSIPVIHPKKTAKMQNPKTTQTARTYLAQQRWYAEGTALALVLLLGACGSAAEFDATLGAPAVAGVASGGSATSGIGGVSTGGASGVSPTAGAPTAGAPVVTPEGTAGSPNPVAGSGGGPSTGGVASMPPSEGGAGGEAGGALEGGAGGAPTPACVTNPTINLCTAPECAIVIEVCVGEPLVFHTPDGTTFACLPRESEVACNSASFAAGTWQRKCCGLPPRP